VRLSVSQIFVAVTKSLFLRVFLCRYKCVSGCGKFFRGYVSKELSNRGGSYIFLVLSTELYLQML